jgi:DNA-binding CsgD family transcriptional regulator
VTTELTPQEAHIARLARDGRTVEWHLRKVISKLGITSRRELRATLES